MYRLMLLAAVALSLTGCMRSDTQKAQRDARWNDKPAHILCQGYAGVLVDTDTTGRIEFDETGRIDFVDAKTKQLVKTEGECVVTYAR
jgi:hypothetical protein